MPKLFPYVLLIRRLKLIHGDAHDSIVRPLKILIKFYSDKQEKHVFEIAGGTDKRLQ